MIFFDEAQEAIVRSWRELNMRHDELIAANNDLRREKSNLREELEAAKRANKSLADELERRAMLNNSSELEREKLNHANTARGLEFARKEIGSLNFDLQRTKRDLDAVQNKLRKIASVLE